MSLYSRHKPIKNERYYWKKNWDDQQSSPRDGKQTACTIIEAGPCVVTQVKTKETDGYNALQIAFGDKKEKHSIEAEKNHFAKSNTLPKNL